MADEVVDERDGAAEDGDEPVTGQWNYDADNREPPPKGADTLGVREPLDTSDVTGDGPTAAAGRRSRR